MIWIIKKFGLLLSLIAAFVGVLFLPADFLDAENAIRVWRRVFTVGNREILLAVICAVCLLRLAYLDMRRSLNDKDWPPVRTKLREFLAAVFQQDARVAEIKLIADDTTVQAFRTSALAKKLLHDTNWEPIPLPRLPDATSAEQYKGRPLAGDYMSIIMPRDRPGQKVDSVFEILGHGLREPQHAELLAHLRQKQETYRQRIHAAGQRALDNKQEWFRVEEGRVFMDEHDRARWHKVRHETMATNTVMDQLKHDLEELERGWKITPEAETIRQLLEGIGEEKQPKNRPG